MIKFENTEVMNFEGAFRGMRNPLNSWGKSDSFCCDLEKGGVCRGELCPYYEGVRDNTKTVYCGALNRFIIGEDDLNLAQKLIKAGSDHRKFLRQILVSVDIIAPLYWWKEFDTYKVGTVANSCSTMHKVMDKPFTLEDFSFDYATDVLDSTVLTELMLVLNQLRDTYLNFDELFENGRIKDGFTKKDVWYALIQLLPSSYNQRRTVTLNYETLYNIYHSRRNHKLDEWSVGFMDWIDSLPYADDLIKI